MANQVVSDFYQSMAKAETILGHPVNVATLRDDVDILIRLVSNEFRIGDLAALLQVGYTVAYQLLHKTGAWDHASARPGRRVPQAKVREVKRLLAETNLNDCEIARQVGLKSRFVVLKIRKQAKQRAQRQAGQFQPKEQLRKCPEHGLVTTWPCVACAALSYKQAHSG